MKRIIGIAGFTLPIHASARLPGRAVSCAPAIFPCPQLWHLGIAPGKLMGYTLYI